MMAARRADGCGAGRGPAGGFTLVEILFSLLILVVGFSSILVLLFGSLRSGQTAHDRNAAATMIPEAIREIELEHLITHETIQAYPAIPAALEGAFIETLPNAAVSDKVSPYGDIRIGASTLAVSGGPGAVLTGMDVNEWPRRPSPPFAAGGVLTDLRYAGNVAVGGRVAGGTPLRVWYRLEKHPEWWPVNGNEDLTSPFRGLYVLTLVCYRDTEQDMSRPVQVTDPVIVHLRDRVKR